MIYIGSDHAGFCLKEIIKNHLKKNNLSFKDFGCFSKDSCDYPDIAKKVCFSLIEDRAQSAILVCGTGVGMSIVANKIKNIRAVCASNHFCVKHARLHNNCNVLCLGARVLGDALALELVDLFIATNFLKGRHLKKKKKIEN